MFCPSHNELLPMGCTSHNALLPMGYYVQVAMWRDRDETHLNCKVEISAVLYHYRPTSPPVQKMPLEAMHCGMYIPLEAMHYGMEIICDSTHQKGQDGRDICGSTHRKGSVGSEDQNWLFAISKAVLSAQFWFIDNVITNW